MDPYTNLKFLAAYDRRREAQARRMDGLQQSLAQPAHPAQAARPVDRAFVIAKRIARMDRMDRQTLSGRARLAQRNRREYQRMIPNPNEQALSWRKKTSRCRQQSPQGEQAPYDRKKPNLQEANLLQALSSMRIDPPVSRRQRERDPVPSMNQLAQWDRQDYLLMKRATLADVRVNRIAGVAPHGKSSRRRDAPDEQLPIKFKKL